MIRFTLIMMKGGCNMLKDKDLLDYTINCINSNDKFTSIYQLADELTEIGDDITRRAISLLNPLTQYSFLESLILEDKDHNVKLTDYLKSMKYPLPVRYGWREMTIKNDGTETEVDKVEWFEDKHSCYINMFKAAMQDIENCVDCCNGELIKITNDSNKITIDVFGIKDVYEIYEI